MSRTIKFIDTVVRNLPIPDKRTTYWCEGSPSFGIRVTPNNKKSFIFQYKASGKARMVTIGQYPAITIREARAEYNSLYEAVYDYKRDIVTEKKDAIKAQKARMTVSELINDYEAFSRIQEMASIDDVIRAFKLNVIPQIGNKYVDEVNSGDIDKIQHNIIERAKGKSNATSNGRVAVKNNLSFIKRLFNYAKKKDGLKDILKNSSWVNPVNEVESLGIKAIRARVLSLKEIWLFWNKIDSANLSPVTAMTLKFLLTSMQRSKEAKHMKYSSLKDDENVWEMTRYETKNKKMHRVPINSYSHQIIETVKPYTKNSSLIFGSTRNIQPPIEPPSDLKPFSESSLSRALNRNRELIGIDNVTPHDLRGTGATWITAVGLPKFYAKLILNHSDGEKDVTGEHYIQYQYDFEKEKAVKVWDFILSRVVEVPTIEDVPTLGELRYEVAKSGLLH